MRISDERVHELIDIYEQEFGETLSLEEARAMASRLVELYLALAEPTPSTAEVSDGRTPIGHRPAPKGRGSRR